MKYVLSLDIGGTNVRAALISEEYQIIDVVRERTLRKNTAVFINQIVQIVKKVKGYQKAKVIVAGVPGRVRQSGFIDELPNIGISNVNLKETLETTFDVPVYIRNDAEMAAFAEAKLGVGKNINSTYFVTISTGIGGCLIENGVIKNPSGEIGHTLVKYQNHYYELEKIASGDGILKLCALNNLNYESASQFFTDVENKKAEIMPIFNEWLTLITNFFIYISEDFTPDIIALTGGVSKSLPLFWDHLVKNVPTKISVAHFNEDAGIFGAAAYGFSLK